MGDYIYIIEDSALFSVTIVAIARMLIPQLNFPTPHTPTYAHIHELSLNSADTCVSIHIISAQRPLFLFIPLSPSLYLVLCLLKPRKY